MQKVLLVEDERRLSDAVVEVLENAGYAVEAAYDGEVGYQRGRTGEFDIIVLDLMLPGMDGIDVCKTLKQEGVQTPIIMVTARASVPDRIEGLDAGADDYLPKPFSPQELVARLRALSHRFGRTPYASSVRYGDLEFSY
ncbi:MAG: DNA-binding response regulator, partial [Methanosphaera sp. rholeuAM270]